MVKLPKQKITNEGHTQHITYEKEGGKTAYEVWEDLNKALGVFVKELDEAVRENWMILFIVYNVLLLAAAFIITGGNP